MENVTGCNKQQEFVDKKFFPFPVLKKNKEYDVDQNEIQMNMFKFFTI